MIQKPRRRFAFAFVFAALVALSVAQCPSPIPAPPVGSVYYLPPETSSAYYLQTNAARNQIANGDFYSSSTAQGGAGGYHYVTLEVPLTWNASLPITVQVLSPDMNSGDPEDEPSGALDNSQFELYNSTTVINTSSGLPAPGQAGTLQTMTYTPNSVAVGNWTNLFVVSSPIPGGIYPIRIQTGNRTAANSTFDDEQNYLNTVNCTLFSDGIRLGTRAVSYQHSAATVQCLTLYLVVSSSANLVMNNFAMDGYTRVCYYAPSSTYSSSGIPCPLNGTVSGNTQ